MQAIIRLAYCALIFSCGAYYSTQACGKDDVSRPVISQTSSTPVMGGTLKISCQTPRTLSSKCLAFGLKLQKGATDVASYLGQSKCFVSNNMRIDSMSRWVARCSDNNKLELTITNVDKADSGVYICSILNEYSTKVTVNVYYPATAVVLNIDKSSARENDRATVVLTCAASGGNPAYYEYSWLFQRFGETARVLRDQRSSTLTLSRVTYMNAGQYRCDVINDGGKETSNVVSLNVQHKPVVRTILPPELRIESMNHGNVVVTFTARPEVSSFTCAMAGQTVARSRQPTKVERTGNNVWTVSYTQVSVGDYGEYSCTAKNSEGTTPVKLIIGSPGIPEAPTNITVEPTDTNGLRVRWISRFDGGSPQQFTIKFRRKGSTTEWQQISGIRDPGYKRPQSYTIENLEVGSQYDIIVSVVNRYTSGDVAVAGEQVSGKTNDRAALSSSVVAAVVVPILAVVVCITIVAFCILRQKRKQAAATSATTKPPKLVLPTEGFEYPNHEAVNGNPLGCDELDYEVTVKKAYFKRPSQQEEATYANIGYQPDLKDIGADGTIYASGDSGGGGEKGTSQRPMTIVGDTQDSQYSELDMTRKGPDLATLNEQMKRQEQSTRKSAPRKDTEV
ncbi:uncharacterized protein LOC141907516 isoform X2 [Tubulanus polymorphus]|uniref:uncharacterized protein LOC141907516 isoform X2 n=1 Tax=Tubulanus polymorphus TaxID=672921 RepID=UPI003DA2F5C2